MARQAKEARYLLTDHLCMKCSGRILMQTNSGPTGGGNPVFRCSCCGDSCSGMDCKGICWCGFKHRNQDVHPYQCMPYNVLKTHPEYRNKFVINGWNPDDKKSEIGVIVVHS